MNFHNFVFLTSILQRSVGHPQSKVKDKIVARWGVGALERWRVGPVERWSVGALERWSVGASERGAREPGRVELCLARMSFRPFLPLMFIGDPGDKEAYNVPRNRVESAGNVRNEATGAGAGA